MLALLLLPALNPPPGLLIDIIEDEDAAGSLLSWKKKRLRGRGFSGEAGGLKGKKNGDYDLELLF